MAAQPDPYRVLGLQRGASTNEVKAAYRRLVKAFHPDTAGDKAMPRFLAIQAAYDAITGDEPRGAGQGPAAREPWRADPGRARATRGRPAGGPGQARRSDEAGTPRPGRERAEADGGSRTDRGTRTGNRRPRRDRTARATPGSTTYDDAADQPFNPEWSGASWYGTTSGTYWTINPREYADPRKHGPEYQARARRAWARGEAFTWAADDSAAPGESADDDRDGDEPGTPPTDGPSANEHGARDTAAWESRQPPRQSGAFRAASAGETSTGAAAGTAADEDWTWRGFDPIGALPSRSSLPGRAIAALVGWPPIGYAIAAFISESSGCGRYAASCVDTFDIGTWVAQLAIIGLLLALPRLASISAVGTLAMLGASVPGAILLSAAGGAQQRDAAASVLVTVLVIAYIGGVVFAVGRSLRTIRT